mmetsp:Transcript_8862/g.16902  ORF Transcript_8862/g.16902 Transcript_8862/m.16902 type:complete len:269 (+) Transcript_8862:207-1013(+)
MGTDRTRFGFVLGPSRYRTGHKAGVGAPRAHRVRTGGNEWWSNTGAPSQDAPTPTAQRTLPKPSSKHKTCLPGLFCLVAHKSRRLLRRFPSFVEAITTGRVPRHTQSLQRARTAARAPSNKAELQRCSHRHAAREPPDRSQPQPALVTPPKHVCGDVEYVYPRRATGGRSGCSGGLWYGPEEWDVRLWAAGVKAHRPTDGFGWPAAHLRSALAAHATGARDGGPARGPARGLAEMGEPWRPPPRSPPRAHGPARGLGRALAGPVRRRV